MALIVDGVGERFAVFGERKFKAKPRQRVMFEDESWALHYAHTLRGWDNYRLYLKLDCGRKHVWCLAIKAGTYADNEDFRILKKNAREMLVWVRDMAMGNVRELPIDAHIQMVDYIHAREGEFRKEVAKRRYERNKHKLCNDRYFKLVDALKRLADEPVVGKVTKEKKWRRVLVDFSRKFGLPKDVVRDFVDEVLAIGVVRLTGDGFEVSRFANSEIEERVKQSGVAMKRTPISVAKLQKQSTR